MGVSVFLRYDSLGTRFIRLKGTTQWSLVHLQSNRFSLFSYITLQAPVEFLPYLMFLVQSWKNAVNPALIHSALQRAWYTWFLQTSPLQHDPLQKCNLQVSVAAVMSETLKSQQQGIQQAAGHGQEIEWGERSLERGGEGE